MKNYRLILLYLTGLFVQNLCAQEGKILFPIGSDVFYYDTLSKKEKLFIKALYWPVTKIKICKETDKMYWINQGFYANTDLICYSRLDGSEFDTIFKNLPSPYAFDIDTKKNTLVWTDVDDKKIYKSKLDGTDRTEIISTGLYSPLGIIMDTVRNKIIWSDRQTGKINSANYDGSDINTIVDGFTPTSLQLDYKNEKLYWVQNQDGEIYRANLDGTAKELIIDGFGTNTLTDISLDVEDSMLYCSQMASWNRGELLRINLETKELDTLSNDEIKIYTSLSIHYEPGDEELYWADTQAQTVKRLSFQTNEVATLLSSDISIKNTIIFHDSILFYEDFGIQYYDLKRRFKKTIDYNRISSLAVDSLNNIYWYNYDKDSIMVYNFKSGSVKGLLFLNSSAFGKIEWLSDNSLLFLDLNRGFYRYDLDEKVLYPMVYLYSSPSTFAIDDINDQIYHINSRDNEEIGCIDYMGSQVDFGNRDLFNYVYDMDVFNNQIFIARPQMNTPDTSYPGGLEMINLSNFETQSLLDSITIYCVYIIRNKFKSLPAYSKPSQLPENKRRLNGIIFPNPNNGQFQLSIENNNSNLLIEIFNPIGIKIHSEIKKFSNSYNINLPDEVVAKGVYFISIKDEKQTITIPFVLIK
jgi:sugar lactone lactonase YvrE